MDKKYIAGLQKKYTDEIVPALMEQFGYSSVMQTPRLQKIVLNSGVGQAIADKKLIEVTQEEISLIAGQKAVQTMKHEILIGMSQEDVRKAFGPPNIVARDKAGKEIWVLSQIAASIRDIKKNGTSGILVNKENSSKDKKETSQTRGELLSIVINFDKDKNVESFSYH